MSSLMTNIRKISLQEGSSAIGRLLLQLGQAADSTLDAETLAELDKQAAVAACQALDAADGDGDGDSDSEDAGSEAPPPPSSEGNPEEEAPAPGGGDASGDASGTTKEDGVVHEEDSTATTVELSADASNHGDFGSNSGSHHLKQPSPSITANASSSSLMHASSSIHSTTSSHNAAVARSPSTSSSPRFHGAPSPLPRSARSSREASLVLPGGILSATAAAATAAQSKEPATEADSSAEKPAASSSEGPVTVVLQGLDSQEDEKVVVCESKALAHLFTRIRNRDTPPHAFRFYASRMMRILAEEVSRGRALVVGLGLLVCGALFLFAVRRSRLQRWEMSGYLGEFVLSCSFRCCRGLCMAF